jgi:outer membrane protein OmpA-like peptidoglycan-associated protein
VLDQTARILKDNPAIRVEIQDHTDRLVACDNEPIGSNISEFGRKLNRWIEFVIINQRGD